MARKILVCGATGNQGGSVAKLLLQHPDQYSVRALTRNSDSSTARDLKALGAEIVSGDLNVYSYVQTAMKGCWGVFGVTNFYDPKIKGSPHSEEQQGRYLAQAALEADVQCFVWSTLPSSKGMSGGRTVSMIYEGKHAVDGYIKEIGLPACFLLTGNFYENMTLRGHVTYNKETDELEFRQPIIREDAKCVLRFPVIPSMVRYVLGFSRCQANERKSGYAIRRARSLRNRESRVRSVGHQEGGSQA